MDLTRPVLGSSENLFSFVSLFIIFVKCKLMTFLTTFKIFTGILSGPVAFLGFKDLIISFILQLLLLENQNLEFHFNYIKFLQHLDGFNVLQFCLQFLHHFLAKRNIQDFLVQYTLLVTNDGNVYFNIKTRRDMQIQNIDAMYS